ncbi:hypothetical protein POTOM_057094 [Populus tomentosa]|uniref:C2 NT-type domain-containing protein n=1 Tax=Populus tomentosa TaxID=118781 RepID=A0A8X7XVU8_POPTO|nr:hypothetical protein POTOM_057094 [Populus tomentosa]
MELEDGKAHIGCQKFNICFFLHVHSIEGLPSFNGINLSVHWRTKDVVFRTRAAKVLKGMDEFDETLMHKCSIYVSNNGMLWRIESVPSDLNCQPPLSSQCVDAKSFHDVSPNLGLKLSKSIYFLYEKLVEVNWHNSEELDTLSDHIQQLKPTFHSEFEFDIDDRGDEYDNIKFSVAEQGIEMSEMEQMESEQDAAIQTSDGSAIETINVDEIIKDVDLALEDWSFN